MLVHTQAYSKSSKLPFKCFSLFKPPAAFALISRLWIPAFLNFEEMICPTALGHTDVRIIFSFVCQVFFVCLFVFNVGASLCRLHESNILGVRAGFGIECQTCLSLECASHYDLDRGSEWWYSVQSPPWMWGRTSSLLCGCHCP